MTNPEERSTLSFGAWRLRPAFVLALLCLLATQLARAQTFTLLHTFSGGGDGAIPVAGLTLDRGANLYGTSMTGGLNGGGTVYKLTHTNSGWLLNPLIEFNGDNGGGAEPGSGVVIGPDGSLYGTIGIRNGFGAVYKLQPPTSACKSVVCYWTETVLYRFGEAPDGQDPTGNLIFDAAGNIYGTTEAGGAYGFGTVFKLTNAGGNWTEQVLYSFMGDQDGSQPLAGVIVDGSGNLYGTTRFGGVANCSDGCGTVFELSPTGSGWTEQVLYRFLGPANGYQPWGGLILDPAGNLYGTTYYGGDGGGGTVFELSPAAGSWNFNVLYNIVGDGGGPRASLTRDSAGNLYGTFIFPPTLFKLSPSGGGWRYTDLHDFSLSDGTYPEGAIAIDSEGKLYGTCSSEGADLYGTAWEFTP